MQRKQCMRLNLVFSHSTSPIGKVCGLLPARHRQDEWSPQSLHLSESLHSPHSRSGCWGSWAGHVSAFVPTALPAATDWGSLGSFQTSTSSRRESRRDRKRETTRRQMKTDWLYFKVHRLRTLEHWGYVMFSGHLASTNRSALHEWGWVTVMASLTEFRITMKHTPGCVHRGVSEAV